MNARPPAPAVEPELSLCLLDNLDQPAPGWILGVGAASVLVNFALLIVITGLAAVEGTPRSAVPRPSDLARSTPLVFPRELTQKEPNKSDVTKQIHLDDLVSKPELKPEKRIFTPPPSPKPVAPTPVTPAPVVEPPAIRAAQAPPPTLGNTPNIPPPPVAPPQNPTPTEKPKIAFETPGLQSAQPSTRPGGLGRIPVPSASVDEAVRSVGRSGPGGTVVGDSVEEGGIGQTLGQAPSPGRQASQVELLSDPMGVDFKPYLIRVLAAVRRNWFAVIPESARLGRRGRVILQFSINKSGSVPKLVITLPSGTEALDRAAVAGVSASNPFPPLPSEFRGDIIRVQLVFAYNLPSR